MTRDSDEFITLERRTEIASRSKADLFVSIHLNSASTEKPKGFEVYFMSAEATDAAAHQLAQTENEGALPIVPTPLSSDVRSILNDVQAVHHLEASSQFAEILFQFMSHTIPPNGVGVRQGPFTVLSGTRMPAILVEVGYVTNAEDAKSLKLRAYLKRAANAISTGIIEFALKLQKLG